MSDSRDYDFLLDCHEAQSDEIFRAQRALGAEHDRAERLAKEVEYLRG